MKGEGILLRDPGKLPPSARKLLEQIGDQKVTKIVASRTPLSSTTKAFLNIISLGQFEKISKKYFDELFHLAFWINDKYNLEKNEVIDFGTKNPIKSNSETRQIAVNKDITFNQLFENTRKYMGDNNFTAYDAEKNNCQNFLLGILNGNGIGTAEDKKWIKQDTEQVFKEVPKFAKILGNLSTTAGAIVNRLVQGEGRPRRLYEDKKGMYYMKDGKKRYIKGTEGMTQQQIVRINLGELVKPKKKKRRRRKKKVSVTSQAMIAPSVTTGRFVPPVAPTPTVAPKIKDTETNDIIKAVSDIMKYVPREPTKISEPKVKKETPITSPEFIATTSPEERRAKLPVYDLTEEPPAPVKSESKKISATQPVVSQFATPLWEEEGEDLQPPASMRSGRPTPTSGRPTPTPKRVLFRETEDVSPIPRDIKELLKRPMNGKGADKIGKFSIEELSKYYANEATERFIEYLLDLKKKKKGVLLGSWNSARTRGLIYEKALDSDIIRSILYDEKTEKDMEMIETVLGNSPFSQNEFNIAYYNIIKDDLPKKDADEFLAIILSDDVDPSKPGSFADRFVSSLIDLEDVYGLKIDDNVIEKASDLFDEERKLLRGGGAEGAEGTQIQSCPPCNMYSALNLGLSSLPIGVGAGNPLFQSGTLGPATTTAPTTAPTTTTTETKTEPQKGQGLFSDVVGVFNPALGMSSRILGYGFGMAGGCNGMTNCDCDQYGGKSIFEAAAGALVDSAKKKITDIGKDMQLQLNNPEEWKRQQEEKKRLKAIKDEEIRKREEEYDKRKAEEDRIKQLKLEEVKRKATRPLEWYEKAGKSIIGALAGTAAGGVMPLTAGAFSSGVARDTECTMRGLTRDECNQYFEKVDVKKELLKSAGKEALKAATGGLSSLVGGSDMIGLGKGEVEGLYNDQLEDIADGLKIKVPVIASDQIGDIVKQVGPHTGELGFIINTNPSSSNGSGNDGYRPGHWRAVFISNDDDKPSVEFFDPLGDGMEEPLIEGIKKIVDKIGNDKYFLFKENMIKHQADDTNTCGHFSMKFIEDRYNGVPWKKASGYDKCYDQSSEGEKEIMKSVKKYDRYI